MSAAAESEYAALYEREFERACRFAERYLRNGGVDAAQDAFAEFWINVVLEGDGDVRSSRALLYKILRNRILMTRRDRKRERLALASPEVANLLGDRRTNQLATLRVAEGNQLADRIAYIAATLPTVRRRAYELASANGWDARKVATQLEIAYNTARWYLTEAVAEIRRTLERDGYAVPATLGKGPPPGGRDI